MNNKNPISIFWFRRDLRLEDNAALYHALKSDLPVLAIFIFDKVILEKLADKDDARLSYIHKSVSSLNEKLKEQGSSLLVNFNSPLQAWTEILSQYSVKEVYFNNDYEPYAISRDQEITTLLSQSNIKVNSFKDHVIFERNEIVKDDKLPYTIFTAYKRKWLQNLDPLFHFKAYPTKKYFKNFYQTQALKPLSLHDLGFNQSSLSIPDKKYIEILDNYSDRRDFPSVSGTSQIGIHLRFGTISIREVALQGLEHSDVWLSELIWRDFYSMIIWHFPHSAKHSFKKEFEHIKWRNNEEEFKAWCEGKTGYPIVDAGMRQLNTTGWMHNRVRMITASFLCKHLLIDWRWGEAYFARKLIDYDLASNVGGWQWAAGTGNDAAPYFRVFSPELQTKRFDSKLLYIKRWIPEFNDPFKYPKPIVEHKFARERALKAYKDKNY